MLRAGLTQTGIGRCTRQAHCRSATHENEHHRSHHFCKVLFHDKMNLVFVNMMTNIGKRKKKASRPFLPRYNQSIIIGRGTSPYRTQTAGCATDTRLGYRGFARFSPRPFTRFFALSFDKIIKKVVSV